MKGLRVSRPKVIGSPVAHLVDAIPGALGRIAPERIDELNRIVDGLTLEIVEETKLTCYAQPTLGRIRLSTGFVESLWCQAYGAVLFYQRELWGRLPPAGLMIIKDAEALEALKLYDWALRRAENDGKVSRTWPHHLPSPQAMRPNGSPRHVADELTLIGVALLLLHELGHIVLKHVNNDSEEWQLDEEKDADNWASDWILGSGAASSQEISKRALGLGMAMMWLVGRGIRKGTFKGKTHPKDYDRLWNVLDRNLPMNQDDPWAMIIGLLGLHMADKNVPMPAGEFLTFRDAANAMLDVLA